MTVDQYLELLTQAHKDQPRFVATVRASITPLVKLRDVLAGMPEAFDLDTAVGVQQDVCGEWIGVSRHVPTPLTGVYLSWGAPGVGWAEGAWKGPSDPIDGMTSLPDDIYRVVLKARVALNRWDGSIPSAYTIWSTVFGGSLVISIQDYQDMTMVVGLSGGLVDATTRALLINGLLSIKPAGVRIRYYATPPVTGKLFAWGVPDSAGFAGWGTGQWGNHLEPV